QGGSTVSSQSVTYNTTASQPSAPSRAAYTFKGWYTTASGGSPISWSTPITADVTYYAQWTMNTYTVVYHYTDASGNSASSTAVTISTGNVPVMQDLLDDANNHISGTGNYNNTWSSNGTTGCIISNNGLNYDFYSTYTYTCTIHYVYKDRSSISGTDTFDNAPDKTYSTSSGYTINNTSGVNLAPTVGNVSGSDMAPEISNVVYDYYWYLGSLTKNADGTYTLTADSEYHPYIVTILYNGNTYSTTTYNYQDNVALNALNILQGSDKFGQWLQADGTLSTPVFTLLSTSYAYAFRATQNNLIVKLVVKSDSASQVASYTGIELDPCVYESLVNGSTTTIQGGFLITEHFANGSTESRTTIKKYGILRYLITSNGGTTNASFSTAQFLSVAGGTAVSGITNVCIYDSVAGTGTNVNTNNAIIYRVSLTDNSTNEQKVYGIVAYMIDSNGNIYLSNNITNTPSTAGMTTTIQKFDIANRNNPYDPTNGIYPTITTT
ncbi:MAG: InlB B-repeat-containing protein, partial [Bacillota bacterium]|nr:InlB B-repeat-containing protein [Bacillota bacterium]